jgi:hypothetical protein
MYAASVMLVGWRQNPTSTSFLGFRVLYRRTHT